MPFGLTRAAIPLAAVVAVLWLLIQGSETVASLIANGFSIVNSFKQPAEDAARYAKRDAEMAAASKIRAVEASAVAEKVFTVTARTYLDELANSLKHIEPSTTAINALRAKGDASELIVKRQVAFLEHLRKNPEDEIRASALFGAFETALQCKKQKICDPQDFDGRFEVPFCRLHRYFGLWLESEREKFGHMFNLVEEYARIRSCEYVVVQSMLAASGALQEADTLNRPATGAN